MSREKQRNTERSGLVDGPIRDRNRRYKHIQRGSHGGALWRVASAHRAVVSRRMAVRVAVALVSLKVLGMAMVQRTIDGVAAGLHFGG